MAGAPAEEADQTGGFVVHERGARAWCGRADSGLGAARRRV